MTQDNLTSFDTPFPSDLLTTELPTMSWAAESTTTMIVKPQQFSINTKFPATNTVPDLRFQEYTRQLTLLRNFQETLRRQGLNQAFQTVDFDDLTETSRLPGKNHARVVVRDPMRTRHVFKGFDFEYFVQHGPDFHEHQRNTMLHEIRTLAALPIHPNIMPCPDTLAIVRDPGGCARVCGFIQPVMERETLDDQIANAGDTRIPLLRKAR
ncbi:hypothetical protein HYQ44_019901 [Verticillium longisporum]|nr:hypothetical protein HYQ44_019901 [Verticillium longisporum]